MTLTAIWNDTQVLSLRISVAPTKVLIVPLSNSEEFIPVFKELSARLRALGIANNIDSTTASIGKRYARKDKLGTPLGIAIDFDTLKDGLVTLRERESMSQVRGSEDDIVQAARDLADGAETWNEASSRPPAFEGQSHG